MSGRINTPDQLRGIRQAAQIGTKAIRAGLNAAQNGYCNVANIEGLIRSNCRESNIQTIEKIDIRCGKRVTIEDQPTVPHYELQNGDIVSIQLAGVYQGYAFEFSRVTIVGNPSKEQQDLLNHLKEVADWMSEFLQAGKPIQFYYTESRGRFIYPAFHGIGLELKEEPIIGMKQRFEPQPGMVLIVKPVLVDPQYGRMCHSEMIEVQQDRTVLLQ